MTRATNSRSASAGSRCQAARTETRAQAPEKAGTRLWWSVWTEQEQAREQAQGTEHGVDTEQSLQPVGTALNAGHPLFVGHPRSQAIVGRKRLW